AIGGGLGKVATRLRKPFHKPEVHWGAGAARFRKQTIKLVEKRWAPLTLTTILSHMALWFILLLALRHVGVSEHEVSTIQVLAAQEKPAEAPTRCVRGANHPRGRLEVTAVRAGRSLISLSLGVGLILTACTGGHSTGEGSPSASHPVTIASFDFVENEILAQL